MNDREKVGPFQLGQLELFVQSVFAAAGSESGEALIVSREVVDAEARGYEAQGLMRVPSYVGALRDGSTSTPTTLEVLRDAPSALAWDAHNGWGHVAALRATEQCVARAKHNGSCVGVVRNIGHIGRLGFYVETAATAGVIGFIACSGNPGSATMAPWGGREARLSTNPFAYGFPSEDGDPVVIDISTTQAARGKVLVAAATGELIPETWAFDARGVSTTDPTQALPPQGTLAPLGGHKGYALAIAVELLCGGLGGEYPPPESSVFIAAFDVAHLTSQAEYASAVSEIDRSMRSSAPRPGFPGARLPGAGSAQQRRTSERQGLYVTTQIWARLLETAASVGVTVPDELVGHG